MSVAVQVVNGREPGNEEEEVAVATAPETTEESPSSPKEEVLSDGEEHTDAPKKKKFKPWKSFRNIFKKKKSSKGSEGDEGGVPRKTMSKSTGELETEGNEGELNKRISMSEDSVFTPDKSSKDEARNSYTLNTSSLTDEINAKLKERASSSDEGYAHDDAMTSDSAHDNSEIAPLDSSKTDSGIVTAEDEKSFSSIGAKDNQHASADNMKAPNRENPGDIDLDLVHGSALLSSSAAKHRISVAPSNRRPSRKSRASTPQKRSSSRIEDTPTTIEEEPLTPTKSPVPIDLDSSLKKESSPVVIIETPPPENKEKPTTIHSPSSTKEVPTIPCPKEVIIIMKDVPEKKEEVEEVKKVEIDEVEQKQEQAEEDEKEEEKEVKEEKPATPTSSEPPMSPVKVDSVEEVQQLPEEKEEVLEKETLETEKEGEEKVEEEKAVEEEQKQVEEEEEPKQVVEEEIVEKRLSVRASKALFEARIPAPDPVKKSSSSRSSINGSVNRNGSIKTETRRSSDPESKVEADAQLSEKEKQKENMEEKDVPVISEEAEEKEPISLKDRISRYQNLSSTTSVKGITSHVPRQRPVSTSTIENKDSSKKSAPKVPSKPSSTNSNKSMETTTDTSKLSTNSTSSSSDSRPRPRPLSDSTLQSPSKPLITSTPPRKPLQPTVDRCMVCDTPVYPNEISKFEGHIFHRKCQKCSECNRTLTLWNLDIADNLLYCKQHGTVIKNNQLKERLMIEV